MSEKTKIKQDLIHHNNDSYYTILKKCEGIFKDKGSRFISFAFPVSQEEEVKIILNEIKKKYHDARHHCYAYRINPENPLYRINDDGEPSGTAGKPIYGQILSFNLYNILIVVVRYFGGTLLGTSGLINAYKAATMDCIKQGLIVEQTLEICFDIMFPYEKLNQIMRIIKEENISIIKQNFNNDCQATLSIRKNNYIKVAEKLEKVDNLKIITNIL